MRICPECNNKTLGLKNVFSWRYQCGACGSTCTSSTKNKAIGNVLINVLPLLGILLAVVFKSGMVFFIFVLVVPLAICWWHQRSMALHVVS